MAGQDTSKPSWRQKVDEVQNKQKKPYQFDWQTGVALDKMNWKTALGYSLGRALNKFLIAPALDRWMNREPDKPRNNTEITDKTEQRTPGKNEIFLPTDGGTPQGQGDTAGLLGKFGQDYMQGGYQPNVPDSSMLSPNGDYFNQPDVNVPLGNAARLAVDSGITPGQSTGTTWGDALKSISPLSDGKDFLGNVDTSAPVGDSWEELLKMYGGR